MKNIKLILLLTIFSAPVGLAQEVTLQDLTAFDKVVLTGSVGELQLISAGDENPVVKVDGTTQENVTANVVAGVLNLTIKNSAKPVDITIYNGRLRRISGASEMKLLGAEVIGGDTGNYLVVAFDRSHEGASFWASSDHDFHVHIPDINVDIPEMDFVVNIPEMDFDMDIPEMPDMPDMEFDFDFDDHHFDFDMEEFHENMHEWEHDREDHKEKMKQWKEEKEERKEEIKEEIKEHRKEMKRKSKD